MDLWILRIWKGLLMGLKRRTDAVSDAWRQASAVGVLVEDEDPVDITARVLLISLRF